MRFVYDDGLETDGVDLPQTFFPKERLVRSYRPILRVSLDNSRGADHVHVRIPRRLVLCSLLDLDRPTREEPHNLLCRLPRKLDTIDDDEGPRCLRVIFRRTQS